MRDCLEYKYLNNNLPAKGSTYVQLNNTKGPSLLHISHVNVRNTCVAQFQREARKCLLQLVDKITLVQPDHDCIDFVLAACRMERKRKSKNRDKRRYAQYQYDLTYRLHHALQSTFDANEMSFLEHFVFGILDVLEAKKNSKKDTPNLPIPQAQSSTDTK